MPENKMKQKSHPEVTGLFCELEKEENQERLRSGRTAHRLRASGNKQPQN